MGFLKDLHGMTLLGNVPEGTCPECAVKHDPQQPHNKDSLAVTAAGRPQEELLHDDGKAMREAGKDAAQDALMPAT